MRPFIIILTSLILLLSAHASAQNAKAQWTPILIEDSDSHEQSKLVGLYDNAEFAPVAALIH